MSLHFIRPEWLLALLPLAIVLLLLWRQQQSHSAWSRYIAPHLARILVTQGGQRSRRPLYMLAFCWLIATLSLAGPAVNKQSLPVFAADQGRVLVMDMSISMFATDIAPNRLTQAKFRATDFLRELKEGETGLVAFAGDAFTISPLTRDTGTLLNLLPTLSPEIMPVRGSNLAAALSQATNLLAQGGHIRGDIIVMTDGITSAQFDAADAALNNSQYRLAILAIGTTQGAPIRLPDGQLQRDSSDEVVVAQTDFALLQKLAQSHNGVLIQSRSDGQDLVQLQNWLSEDGDTKATDLSGETWQDLGPYLALLLLLPVLLSFRQGLVASIGGAICSSVLTSLLLSAPQTAHANSWDDMWKTPDQQAMAQFNTQNYSDAAAKFESPQWRGSAQYKAGDFEQALKTFEQDSSAQGLYNQGNALMQLNKPTQAKERYQAALNKQADFPAAKANLALAEKLEQQQNQQNDGQGQQGDSDDQNSDKSSDQQQQDNSGGNPSQGQKSQDQQPQDQPSQDGQSQNQPQDADEQKNSQDKSSQDEASQASADQDEQSKADNEKNTDEQQRQDTEQQASSAQRPEDMPDEPQENEAKMQAKVNQDDAGQDETKAQDAQSASAEASHAANDNTDNKQSETHAAPEVIETPLPADMQRALRAVNEDPQVLLRNKMQLEYQKRRQNGPISRDNEQW